MGLKYKGLMVNVACGSVRKRMARGKVEGFHDHESGEGWRDMQRGGFCENQKKEIKI